MKATQLLLLLVLVTTGGLVVLMLPEIRRYLKIRSM
jgi:hypothetical protein